MQAGDSRLEAHNFVDGYSKATGVVVGLGGRLSERIERITLACIGLKQI